MKISAFFCLFSLFFSLSFATILTSAASEDGTDQIPFANQTENIRGLTEGGKWDYLGEKWKEILLQIDVVRSIDTFLHSINILFVIFFATSYSLSGVFVLVFLLWLTTAISLSRYFVFFKSGWLRAIVAVAITTILAHIGIFNLLAGVAFRVIFDKTSGLWDVLIFIILVVALYICLTVNKMIAKNLKISKENQKKQELEHRLEMREEYDKSIEKNLT